MENIPRIIHTDRLPVDIPVHACLLDHHVEGQAVLPAVMAMQVIEETVKPLRREPGISVMTRGRLDKFLPIHSGMDPIPAYVDIDTYENGDLGVKLLTRNRIKTSSISRIKEHAAVYYPFDPSGISEPMPDPDASLFSALKGNCIEIEPDSIYRELVPFGEAFHSIQDSITISGHGVIARIGTPAAHASPSISNTPCSPFPLDAAYHCACVWGQRYARTVAFPVGFEKRTLWHHTLPGESYFCRILPVQTHPQALVFDLWIVDEYGVLFEEDLGVSMKDVTAGRLKPPEWISADLSFPVPEGASE